MGSMAYVVLECGAVVGGGDFLIALWADESKMPLDLLAFNGELSGANEITQCLLF